MSVVLDQALILQRFGGDAELLAELARMFIEESDRYCRALEGALAAASTEAVQREAHTLKGLLATLADEEGQAMASALERLAVVSSSIEALRAPTEALVERVQEVSEFLRRQFGGASGKFGEL